ncbi:cadherin-15 isoform X1 [Polypterus senegalus]|uniref:cadherin-15 isoform X1 n=1 Tax=Polypterus senegalus TaxID=55291 RepID=UPI0019634625|nr:cadherin-15 isoform X1 [Polypterus senegalus]
MLIRGLTVCLWLCLACQVACAVESEEEEQSPGVLFPWRLIGLGHRVKRAWVIPPVNTPENAKQIPKRLVQIKSDTLKPGEVIYRIKGPGVDEDPKGFFSIEEKTGWVILTNVLDREKQSKFKIKAFALDLSGKTLEDPTELEIVVVDQNDNRPVFTESEFIGNILEHSEPGTFVMNVTATDADDIETDNALLRYSIHSTESIPPFRNNKTMFGIDGETGVISSLDVGLDREDVEGFNLTIQVADMEGNGLSSFSTALIYITDINDNAPNFTLDVFYMSVPENKAPVDIGRITVTDEDEPMTDNWWAKFTITIGNEEGNFVITTDTLTNEGIVTVLKPLDYEAKPAYKLIVKVENTSPLSALAPKGPQSSATVIISVLNHNEAPVFRTNPLTLAIPEGTQAGTVLFRNIAFDPDRQALRYALKSDPDGWLTLNSETGEISAKKDIGKGSPFLINDVYAAVLTVSELGHDSTTATATVEITVLEVNDFPPELFPLTGSMCHDPKKGPGLVLTAVDRDHPPHSAPFEFVLDPNYPEQSQNWTINPINGTHAILGLLSPVDEGIYIISVSVEDSGEPTKSSIQEVNVTVCHCNGAGSCQPIAAAIFQVGAGLSLEALLIILGSIVLLLLFLLLMTTVSHCRHVPVKQGLLGISDDDIRDNILNYDEQGGGEEDEDGYNIDQLRNPNDVIPSPIATMPRMKQPLRKDAPYNYPSPSYPRKAPNDPTDIEHFINDALDAADNDPNVPPYDTALIYDYEGDGSMAGSLSSIATGSSDGDHDYDYLNDWGPRFKKLADLYDSHGH